MKAISTQQFIASETLLTLGIGFMLSSYFNLGVPFITASGIVCISRTERSRPLSRKDAVWITVALFAMAVLWLFPSNALSDSTVASIERILQHPAFLIAFWLLSTFLTYRLWRHAKTTTTVA